MGKKQVQGIISNTNKFSWYSYNRITDQKIKDFILSDYQVVSKYNLRAANSIDFPYVWMDDEVNEEVLSFCKEVFNLLGISNIANIILNRSIFGCAPIALSWFNEEITDLVLLTPQNFKTQANSSYSFNNSYNKRIVYDNYGNIYPLDYYKPTNPANFVFLQSDNGRSELECVFNLCLFKRRVIELWDRYFDKASVPTVVGQLDPNLVIPEGYTFQTYADMLSNRLENIRSGAGVILSGLSSLSNLNIGSASGFDTALNYIDASIGMVILGSSRTTDAGNAGSYASDKTSESAIFRLAKLDNKEIENFINILLFWQTQVKFGMNVKAPKILFDREEGYSLTNMNEALKLGIKISKNKYYKYVPEPIDESDVLIIESNNMNPQAQFSEQEETKELDNSILPDLI